MKKLILPVAALVLVAIVAIGIAQYQKANRGDTSTLSFLVAEKSVEELSKEASKVVLATVDAVIPSQLASEKVNGRDMIYTDVILSVQDTLKNSHADKITIRLPGGTIGEGKQKRSILVEDIPEFKVGDEVVVFLGKGTDGLFSLPDGEYYSVYGSFQGVYSIQNGKAVNQKATLEVDQLIGEIQAAINN